MEVSKLSIDNIFNNNLLSSLSLKVKENNNSIQSKKTLNSDSFTKTKSQSTPFSKINKLSLNNTLNSREVIEEKDFVKSKNGQFSVDNKPFKFIGTNMYSLARESSEITEKMIKDAANEGFTVIRFWAFQPMKKDKMEEILDLGKKYNVKFIANFITQWELTGEDKKDDHWYKEGYKDKYLPFVKDMVSEFKNRPELMIWELINEPETESFEVMYDFTKNVSEIVDKIDQNHIISLGTIGGLGDKFGSQLSRLNEINFKKLYSLPTLDAISIHDYSYDSTALERLDILYRFEGNEEKSKKFGYWNGVLSYIPKKIDKFFLDTFNTRVYNPFSVRGSWDILNQINIKTAKELQKPLYIGEVGFKQEHGENRKKLLELDIKKQFDRGVQGYTLWSFQAQGRSIDGHDYGFDNRDNFSPIIKKWNTKVNQ